MPWKAHQADFLHFALCVIIPSLFMVISLLSNYSPLHKSFAICMEKLQFANLFQKAWRELNGPQ